MLLFGQTLDALFEAFEKLMTYCFYLTHAATQRADLLWPITPSTLAPRDSRRRTISGWFP